MIVYLEWSEFKTRINNKSLLRYSEQETFYKLSYHDAAGVFESSILKDGTQDVEIADFETNFKGSANQAVVPPSDSENSPITRLKMAPSGWTYKLRGIEFETASLATVYSVDFEGTNKIDMVLKFYDAENAEITSEVDLVNCVKTVLDWEPQHDIELIGGTAKILDQPTGPCRLWVVAVPDVPYAYGGSRVMIDGINFQYIGPNDRVEADGRVSKRLIYSTTYHSNKLRYIIRHEAGAKHQFHIMMEFFKP